MTDEELEQATAPGVTASEMSEAMGEDPEVQDPEIDLQDLEDEIDPEVDQTPAEEPVVLAKQDPMVLIAELQKQLDDLKKAPKNQVAGTPGNRSYVREGVLNTEGKVPQQQADLAKILTNRMPVGEKFTEAQVFGFLNADKGDYPSLVNSRQDVTYLFRYYRGLKPSGKHAGFVARGFLKQS
jgi:hypothetical protein